MAQLSLHSVVTRSSDASGADSYIFLGPSLGSSTKLWDLALPTLAAHHTVVRFDLPGHGESEPAQTEFRLEDLAEAVVNLADGLGIERFDYAGVSVSGALALELSHRYPERISHAAVVCSAPYFGGPDGWSERIDQVATAGTSAVVPSIPERWFAPDFPAKNADLVQQLLSDVASTNDDSYIKVCQALADFDARGYLSDISVPVLVISGELDPGTPPTAGAVIAEGIPGAKQIVIPHTSHQAVVEKPLDVARELVDFFDHTN